MVNDFNFTSVEEMLYFLEKNENVIGILEYGGQIDYDSNNLSQGDRDFTIVLKNKTNNVNGFHIYVNEMPVDCMIKSVSEFFVAQASNIYDLCHIGASILYDKDGSVKKAIDYIETHWKRNVELDSFEIIKYRFKLTHSLNKLRSKLSDDDKIYLQYIFDLTLDSLIVFYAEIKQLLPGKPRKTLAYMREVDSKIYENICSYYKADNFNNKFQYISDAVMLVLNEVGGLWTNEEIIIRDPSSTMSEYEKSKFITELFSGRKSENK